MTTTAPSQYYVPPLPWDLDALPCVAADDAHALPACAAIYFLRTPDAVLYVGQSRDVSWRFKTHARLRQVAYEGMPCEIAWMPLPPLPSSALLALEKHAIALYKPTFNATSYAGPTQGIKWRPWSPREQIMHWEKKIAEREREGKHVFITWRQKLEEAQHTLLADPLQHEWATYLVGLYEALMAERVRHGKKIPPHWLTDLAAVKRFLPASPVAQEDTPDA